MFIKADPKEFKAVAIAAGIQGDSVDNFFAFCSLFFSNMGNYMSFGDSKIIPSVAPAVFRRIVRTSTACKEDPVTVGGLLSVCMDRLYDTAAGVLNLGLFDPAKGNGDLCLYIYTHIYIV